MGRHLILYMLLGAGCAVFAEPSARGRDVIDGDDTYFAILRERFPAAFARYRDPRWLHLTEASILTKGGHTLPRVITIEAERTARGHREVAAEDQLAITAEFNYDARAGLVRLARVFMPTQFQPEYGWRILIAEFISQFPNVARFTITLDSADAVEDVTNCGDLLARGIDGRDLSEYLPVTRAMDDFDFRPRARPTAFISDDAVTDVHYRGELTLKLDFAR